MGTEAAGMTIADRLGAAISESYSLERELGAGGRCPRVRHSQSDAYGHCSPGDSVDFRSARMNVSSPPVP
jgi:hypothetical protein